jgi:TetR/AcrR family transcriptional repressor of lmrAB and yxaGH operons
MTSTRDHIVEITCELLELQGYHATGLNQIISQSGSPKGSLYYYFPGGKEELTTEALQQVGREVLQRIQTSLALIDEPGEAVRTFILNIARNVVASGYRAGGPITTVALETAATNERLREECRLIYAGWQAAFATKLESSGFLPVTAKRLASVIIAAIEGGIILCRTEQSPGPLENVAHELGALISQMR